MSSELGNALSCAVGAAESATQATFAIWQQMAPTEQDEWLASQERCWPRLDVYLRRLLPVAEQVIADEQAAEERARDDRR